MKRHNLSLVIFACTCAMICTCQSVMANNLSANIVQNTCSVFVQNGDTISIYSNWENGQEVVTNTFQNNVLLVDDGENIDNAGNGYPARAVLDDISENALWKVEMSSEPSESWTGGPANSTYNNGYGVHGPDYRIALQNIRTGRWLYIDSSDGKLYLTPDKKTYFSHEHSFSVFRWEDNHITLGKLFYTASVGKRYVAYDRSKKWESQNHGSCATVRFAKWTKCDEKVAKVEVTFNEADSKVSFDGADKRQFYYFPFACWETGGISSSNTAYGDVTPLGLTDTYSQRYTTGYQEQQAVYSLTPKVAKRVYYRSLVENKSKPLGDKKTENNPRPYDFLLVGKTFSVLDKDVDIPTEAGRVTLSAHWGKRGANSDDPTYSRLTTDLVRDLAAMNTYRKPYLEYSKFSDEVLNQYIETAPRNMMKYTLDKQAQTLTIKPEGVSPWNIYTKKEDGNSLGWYYYLDTLTIIATAEGCKPQSIQLPIGRESFHIAYVCRAKTPAISVVKQNDKQPYDGTTTLFGASGGDWQITIDTLSVFRGIGLFGMTEEMVVIYDRNMPLPLLFRTNWDSRLEYVTQDGKFNNQQFNAPYISLFYKNNSGSWGSQSDWLSNETISALKSPQINMQVIPFASEVNDTRSQDVKIQLVCRYPDNSSNLTGSDRGYTQVEAVHTITQTSSSNPYTVFNTQTGRFYAVRDSNKHQQVHTFEQTIYYVPSENRVYSLKLKEPNFFGYVRWYDFNTGKDPQYQPSGTDADGKPIYQPIPDFWQKYPATENGNTFSDFNANDPDHSYGLFYLFPKTAGENDTKNTRANTPTIKFPADFSQDIDIACDVSNYIDYTITRSADGKIIAFTEPTLSYRQIFHFRRGDAHDNPKVVKEIADALAECTTKTGRFYEEHEYEMPIGNSIDMITNHMLAYANGARAREKYWLKMDNGAAGVQHGLTIDGNVYAHLWGGTYQPEFFLRDPQTGKLTSINLTFAKDKDNKDCDYITVNSTTPKDQAGSGAVESREYAYCLVPNKTFGTHYTGDTILLILQKVNWVNRDTLLYGPSAKTIITLDEIERNYVMLSKQDFDFNKPGTTTPTLYNIPLDPGESTMGFVPSRYIMRDRNNPNQYLIQREAMTSHTDFPNYGEYCFINIVGTDEEKNGRNWLKRRTQHTGRAEDGYCLYADGTDQPGRFLALNTNAKLCGGQQMYCSLWLCNPSNPTPGYPDAEFKVVMEGRNKDKNGAWESWEEIKSFYIGKFPGNGPWRQINFPVDTRNDYEESRLVFYNYATGNGGNNFLVDDVYLYASRIPLEAFQVNTTCMVSNTDPETSNDGTNSGIQKPIHGLQETDNVATIIRVDYENLLDGFSDKKLYYQIYEYYTLDPCRAAVCQGDSALLMNYHNDSQENTDNRYGVVRLPNKTKEDGFTPPEDKTFASLDVFLEYIAKEVERTRQLKRTAEPDDAAAKGSETYIGYVPIEGNKRYVLYIVQMLKMNDLNARHQYEVRTGYAQKDLDDPMCSMRTNLPVYEPTAFMFNGETYPTVGQCANSRYPLEILVRQEIVIGDHSYTLGANARAEWLNGFVSDSIYYNAYREGATMPTDPEKCAIADAAFLEHYGYPRADVNKAIEIMRRDPSSYQEYTNYYVLDYHDLKKGTDYWGFERPEGKEEDYYYDLIVDLCERNLLRLATERDDIYLMSNDTVCYWIYPTAGTARATYDGEEYILNQCAAPKFIMVYSKHSDNSFTLGLKNNEITKGIVPRVRITEYEANHRFGVPCYISKNIVMEWDSTQLDATGTNDPVILEKMKQKGFSMHYSQNIIYTNTEHKYYNPEGDTIYFTPVDQAHVDSMKALHKTGNYGTLDGHPGCWVVNSDTMHAGYQYTLRSQMKKRPLGDFDDSGDSSDEEVCSMGYAYVTLVIVPDTLVWTPMHEVDGNYQWGEDQNWSGLIQGQLKRECGYAPIKSSVVIIPEGLDPEKYPYIDDVKVDAYSKDINYLANVCKKVQFRRDVRIIGQHNLQYDSAYVDMTVRPVYSSGEYSWGGWNSLAAPLQGMYAGDFYIPHTGMYDDANRTRYEKDKQPNNYTEDFQVGSFRGTRSGDAAYAFWARYHDKEVYNYTNANYYEGTTPDTLRDDNQEGQKIESIEAGFYTSNRLNQPLSPGEGFALYALGDGEESLEIRLPKPDTKYYYYKADGTQLSGSEPTPRTNSYRLAYTPDENGNMTITLKNRTRGNYFLLGNPTMSYLSVAKLMEVNSGKLEGAFYILENGQWQAGSIQLSQWWEYPSRYIAPMQSVMLKTTAPTDMLTLTITPGCLSLTNNPSTDNNQPEPEHATSASPKRAKGHRFSPQMMRITAYTNDAESSAMLALIDFANNGYQTDEDVTALSSGIENDKTSGVLTPVNIYTLAGSRTLAVDIREQLKVVPLGFVIDNDYRTDSIVLQFEFNLAWGEECYLCDTLTGKRTRIYNDLRLRVPTPRNHEIRYYILGRDSHLSDTPSVPTEDQPVVIDKGGHITAFSPQAGKVEVYADGFIADVRLYDVTGRLVAMVPTQTNTPTMSLHCPSGVMFADVRLRSGIIYRTKVFVR